VLAGPKIIPVIIIINRFVDVIHEATEVLEEEPLR